MDGTIGKGADAMPLKTKSGNQPDSKSAMQAAVTSPDGEERKTALNLDILLDRFYRLAYYMGAQIVRTERRYGRRMELWFNRFRDQINAKYTRLWGSFKRRGRSMLRDAVTPVLTAHAHVSQYGERVRAAAKDSRRAVLLEILQIVWEVLRYLGHGVARILNYVAPVCAVVALVITIQHFTSLNFALKVNYGGQDIGYITDESVFENAEKEVQKRIVYADTAPKTDGGDTSVKVLSEYVDESAANPKEAEPALVSADAQVISMPQYQLAMVTEDQLTDQDTLTNRIIEASGSEITQASGLYIGGSFKGASTEPEKVLDIMNDMLDQYETGNETETIHFVSKVELKDGLYPVQSLKDTAEFSNLLTGNVSGESYYTVVAGDSPSLIADKTGIPLRELNAMNPDIDEDFLPGKQLLISRSVPMMKVQVTRRETYEEDIPYETEYVDNAQLLKGVEEIKTSGLNGTKEVVADITYVDDVEVSRTIVKETVVSEPRTRVISRGTNVPKASGNGTSTGGFIWPVVGSPGYNYISCRIWGYWGHTGTDIAARSGTPIVASMSGRVVKATQTRYGYGKHIIIQHDNGMQTLYAHCSALYVNVGDYVEQGQIIAAVGRTGNASGNHCHFEIRQNGAYLDATRFIGTKSPY